MKRILLIVILIAIIAGGIYAWREYNRKNVDLQHVKADVETDALSMIAAFEKDTATAGRQYTDKVITVRGTVKKLDAEENPVVLFLGDPARMSSVQCSMDSTYAGQYQGLKEGATVTVKGKCTGYQYDDLLGTDIKLNRCVLVANP